MDPVAWRKLKSLADTTKSGWNQLGKKGGVHEKSYYFLQFKIEEPVIALSSGR